MGEQRGRRHCGDTSVMDDGELDHLDAGDRRMTEMHGDDDRRATVVGVEVLGGEVVPPPSVAKSAFKWLEGIDPDRAELRSGAGSTGKPPTYIDGFVFDTGVGREKEITGAPMSTGK